MATTWYFRDTNASAGPTGTLNTTDSDYFPSVPSDKNTPKDMNATLGSGQTSTGGSYNNAGSARKTLARIFVGPALAGSQTLTGGQSGYSIGVGYMEGNAQQNLLMRYLVYLWRSGTGIVKTIYGPADATEHGTSEVECVLSFSGASGDQAIQEGDRIVVEVWFNLNNTKSTAYTATLYYDGTDSTMTDGTATSNAGSYFTCPQTLNLPSVTRELLASIPGSSTTPGISALTARSLLAAIAGTSTTSSIQYLLTRNLSATIPGASTTPGISSTMVRAILASILAESSTPGVGAMIARSIQGNILATSVTPDDVTATLETIRALLASIAGQSTTPDISYLLARGLSASVTGASVTPAITAFTVREILAGIAAQSITGDVQGLVQRLIAAAIVGESLTPQAGATLSRSVLASIAIASSTPDISGIMARVLTANIPAQSVTPEITITMEGVISLLANIAASSTTPAAAVNMARSLLASIAAQSTTSGILAVTLRELAANIQGLSVTPDITAIIGNLIELSAAIVGSGHASSSSSIASNAPSCRCATIASSV